MTATTLNNVNFKLLLQAHNGDMARARAAWEQICHLGGYGGVPVTYDGGLDVSGIRIAREEQDQGGNPTFQRAGALPYGKQMLGLGDLPKPPAADDIKRLEDIASGDAPQGDWRNDPDLNNPPQGDWR